MDDLLIVSVWALMFVSGGLITGFLIGQSRGYTLAMSDKRQPNPNTKCLCRHPRSSHLLGAGQCECGQCLRFNDASAFGPVA